MKNIMNWLKESYHSYCKLVDRAAGCGLGPETYWHG